MAEHDVIIAGLGPVGGLLAALLGGRGLRVAVVEPSEEPYDKPRAAVLDAEALRVLATLPGMPPLATWATPVTRNSIAGPDRRPLVTVEVTARLYGQPSVARIDQPRLESALRAAVTAAGVEVVPGRRVTGAEQTPEAVTVTLDDGTTLTASWLVGCDGASSTVRAAAGLDFPGRTFEQPWLVADAAVPAEQGSGETTFSYVLDPDRPAVAMSQPGGWRWEWMLLPGEDPAAMTRPETVRGLIEGWTDPDRLELRRSAVFTFHSRTASRWRQGRILLAGDAAHVMPPFAGAGLGMGLRDAISLAWRLAEADPGAVLDGYERERRPDVESTTTLALRAGRILQSRSRAGSRLLRTVLAGVGRLPLHRMGSRPLPPRKLPGTRSAMLPNPRVSVAGAAPVPLDEVIGYRWAYLGHGCDPRSVLAAVRPDAVVLAVDAPETGPGTLPVADPDGALPGEPGTVTLVRPDRFVQG